mmetsp:Transcript_5602/g.7264  ORF Transcript_5602/g.7264 Transcript_5602/m.7264 type:complete len:352 (+) Transcript_5602:64-1119(+)
MQNIICCKSAHKNHSFSGYNIVMFLTIKKVSPSSVIVPLLLFLNEPASSEEGGFVLSSDKYIYWTAFSSNNCADGSLVGTKGVVALEESMSAGRVPPGNSCANELACLYEGSSDRCQSMNPSLNATGVFYSQEDGDYYACDSTNFFEGEWRCSERTAGQCFNSSVYLGCTAQYFVASDFQNNPELFKNSNAEDLQDIEDHYYAIYYSDNDCSSLEGFRALYSEEAYTFPVTKDDSSCADAIACLLNPTGPSCKEHSTDSQMTFVDKTEGEGAMDLYECDENSMSCVFSNPNKCTKSNILSACYYRKVSATFLATNPNYIIGVQEASSSLARFSMINPFVIALFATIIAVIE